MLVGRLTYFKTAGNRSEPLNLFKFLGLHAWFPPINILFNYQKTLTEKRCIRVAYLPHTF